MAQPTPKLDFFVLEASDYLERLDVIAQTRAGVAPGGEEFVRLARAFRGSALMAGEQVMARAAQGLEAAARAVRDGRLGWDERVRAEVVRAVDDCKVLLRRVKSPDPGDSQRAESIGSGLERMVGQPAPAARAQPGGLDAGGRAFVAREAATIASTLDRVSRALSVDPLSRDALSGVAPAMSQLRGVAILADLPPLADTLAAVDWAVKSVHAARSPVEKEAAAAFDAAAKALARAAREVVETGRPTPESPEARAFAASLLRAFVRVGDPVPIELLAPADATDGVVTAGRPPETEGSSPSVEFVSQGEFLSAAATELGRASSAVQRDLRLFAIGASLRPLIESGGSPLTRALAAFAEAGWWSIGTGAAAAEPERFVEVVSDAAATLRSAGGGADEPRLARLLSAHASRLLMRLPYPPPAPAPVPAVAPQPAAPVAAAEAQPTRRATAPRRLPALLPQEGGGLAASWAMLEALIDRQGLSQRPLEELLGIEAAAVTPAPPAAAALAPELPIVPIESLAPAEPAIVPIESLLYDGAGAQRRVVEIRVELDELLAGPGAAQPRIRDLLGEVFDLVDIGFASAR